MKKLFLAILFLLISKGIILSQTNEKAANALQKADRLFFIENKGQWHSDVLYLCRMGGLDAWITKYGMNYTFYKVEKDKNTEFARIAEGYLKANLRTTMKTLPY
jgi:hypothetical protein